MAGFRYDEEKHTFVLQEFSSVESAIARLTEMSLKDLVITDELSYKALYKARTEINNQVKQVATLRKQMVATITGQFVADCKAIEKAGATLTEEMTERLLAFKPKEQKEKEIVYSMTISTTNRNAFEKVKTTAINFNCEIVEKIK